MKKIDFKPGRSLALAAALALAVALSSDARLRAQTTGTLRQELATVVKNLVKLPVVKGSSIAIGQFTGPGQSNFGPGIVQVLKEEMIALGFSIAVDAQLTIKGEYSLLAPDDTNGDALTLRVTTKLVDRLGNEVGQIVATGAQRAPQEGKELRADVSDEATVLAALGANVSLPATPNRRRRAEVILNSVNGPELASRINGTKVFDGPQETYALEVLAAPLPANPTLEQIVSAVKPVQVNLQGNLPFAPLQERDTYAIRLINNSDYEAAVRLSIDGLNTFAFSEQKHDSGPRKGEPLLSVWLIPPKESRIVPGWYKTSERVEAFLLTQLAESAAAREHQLAGVGVITAVFSAAWPVGGERPSDEPAAKKGSPPDLATGFGPSLKVDIKELRRTMGAPRASITIRYTRDNN